MLLGTNTLNAKPRPLDGNVSTQKTKFILPFYNYILCIFPLDYFHFIICYDILVIINYFIFCSSYALESNVGKSTCTLNHNNHEIVTPFITGYKNHSSKPIV